MTISVRRFTLFFFLYALISVLVYFLTSAGWTWLYYFFVAAPFFLVLTIIAGTSSFFAKRRGVSSFHFSSWLVAIVFILQIVILLFNYGNCGDASGNFNFLQRVLGLSKCSGGAGGEINAWIPFGFIVLLELVHGILILRLLISLFKQR